MEKRLDATLSAVKTMQPALAKFYDSLSDEQKAHFNSLRSASDLSATNVGKCRSRSRRPRGGVLHRCNACRAASATLGARRRAEI